MGGRHRAWLRQSTTTTDPYVEADVAMTEKALALLQAPDTKLRRYQAPGSLMRFLQSREVCRDIPGPDCAPP